MAAVIPDLGSKLVAVGSGKGGVGKSTTSANLAVLGAREGLRIGLIDLDPLSDLAIVFDLPPALMEKVHTKVSLADQKISLNDFRIPLFPRLDLLFPHVKLGRGESSALRELIFRRFAAELDHDYDLLILDMPAGIGQEENLAFLPHLRHLVIVTNSEPTSHVSAGGFIKAAREINEKIQLYLWHNKFENAIRPEFNPRTLWENYNHFVPDDLKLDQAAKDALTDIAFVPHDASLNLLLAEAEYHHHLMGKFVEVLDLLDEQAVAELPAASEVPKPLRIILRHFVIHQPDNLDWPSCSAYFQAVLGKPGFRFPLDQELYIQKYLQAQKVHPLRQRLAATRKALTAVLNHMASDGSLFTVRMKHHEAELQRHRSHADVELRRLIDFLAFHHRPSDRRPPWPLLNSAMIKNLGALLLYFFALHRLSEHTAIQAILASFVPHRKTADGKRFRNRFQQIRLIIEHDSAYHQRYFSLIKRLFPIMQKQLLSLAKARKWDSMILRDTDHRPNHNAYLKLLTRTVHDMVNGGLGIHVGIRHNAAAMAIQEGGIQLVSKILPSAFKGRSLAKASALRNPED